MAFKKDYDRNIFISMKLTQPFSIFSIKFYQIVSSSFVSGIISCASALHILPYV